MRQQKQQGDVLFLAIDELPVDAKPVKMSNGQYILAEGEATGHNHCIEAEEGVELFEKDGVLFLKHSIPVITHHQEHHAVTLEKGIWEVGRVSEIDPFKEEIYRVRD